MRLYFDEIDSETSTVWLIDYESGGNSSSQRFILNPDSSISPKNLPHLILDIGDQGRLQLREKKRVKFISITYQVCNEADDDCYQTHKQITFKGKQINSVLVIGDKALVPTLVKESRLAKAKWCSEELEVGPVDKALLFTLDGKASSCQLFCRDRTYVLQVDFNEMRHGAKVLLRSRENAATGPATFFMLKSDGTICPDPAKYPNVEDLMLGTDPETGHTCLMFSESDCKPLVFSFRDSAHDQTLPKPVP